MQRLTGLVCIVGLTTVALGFSFLGLVTEGVRWVVDYSSGD